MGKYIVLSDSSEKRSAEKSARNFGAHWARLGDKTVVWTISEEWDAFTSKARQAGISLDQAESRELEGQLYLVIQTGRAFQDTYPEAKIVVEKGRYLVADLLPEKVRRLAESKDEWWTVRPLAMDSVIMDIVKPEARAAVSRVQANVDVCITIYIQFLPDLTGEFPDSPFLKLSIYQCSEVGGRSVTKPWLPGGTASNQCWRRQ